MSELKVGGRWLSTIAPWGELEWSHSADGGCKAASWKMDVPLTFFHPALSRPALVQVMEGPTRVWAGMITEPDIADDGTVNAVGLSQLGMDYIALDGSGNSTSKPDTAIDTAIANGLPWTRPASLSSAVYAASDPTDGINHVGDLLSAWSDSAGKRWGVDALARAYAAADPTVPMWHLAPGAPRLGLADDDYASDIVVRYLDSGGYATVRVSDSNARSKLGPREYPVDATAQGVMTLTQATALGNALLAKGKARLGFTDGVEVTNWQLTTPGGAAAALWKVRGQQMVRQFGVRNEMGQASAYLDWVIGETSYQAGAGTISLTPVGLADRNLGDVLTVNGNAFSASAAA